jgi:hypothetical protein
MESWQEIVSIAGAVGLPQLPPGIWSSKQDGATGSGCPTAGWGKGPQQFGRRIRSCTDQLILADISRLQGETAQQQGSMPILNGVILFPLDIHGWFHYS